MHLASLLLAAILLCGVGILEGLTPGCRGDERGLAESITVSDMSEQTDWISEMSKSEASLPRRLLPRLPALLPGLLGNLLCPEKGQIQPCGKYLFGIYMHFRCITADYTHCSLKWNTSTLMQLRTVCVNHLTVAQCKKKKTRSYKERASVNLYISFKFLH